MAKKVQTPIDHRETFVSIQNIFAEDEKKVAEKLRTLYRLQQTDSNINKIARLRGNLPGEVDRLKQELEIILAKKEEVGECIDKLEQSIGESKEKIVEIDSAISDYKKQLNEVVNSREYDSISKEVEFQEINREVVLKYVNDGRLEINKKQEELKEIDEDIAVGKGNLKLKKEELEEIEKSTKDEEKFLLGEREKYAGKIDERTLSAYDRIRDSVNNRLAVVTVYYPENGKNKEGACGGCFNTIIPQTLIDIKSNKKLIICEHCGRIIVSDDIDSANEGDKE